MSGHGTRKRRASRRLLLVGAGLTVAGVAALTGGLLALGSNGDACGGGSCGHGDHPSGAASGTAEPTGSASGAASPTPGATDSTDLTQRPVVVVVKGGDKGGDSTAEIITATGGAVSGIAGAVTMVLAVVRREPLPQAAPTAGPDTDPGPAD